MNRMLYSLILAAGAATAAHGGDLLITNARISTLDPDRPEATALLVRDDRIAALGEADVLRRAATDDARVIDAGGRRLIPGLNDSHLHVVRGGRFHNLELRWEGLPSLKLALDLLADQVARTPEGQWVRVVGGWSPDQFEEQRMPTPAELDAIAPETPVFVLYLYSGGILNAAGMRALGIDEHSVAPPGSRYERDAAGRPTGVLVADPNPMILYRTIGALPQLDGDALANSSRHFYRRLLALGVTSAIDAGGGGHRFPDDYAGTALLAERGELPLRVASYLFPQTPGQELHDFRAWTDRYEADGSLDRFRPDGYVIEGGGELLVWSASDYENFRAPRPDLKPGAEAELEAVVRHLVTERWPFRIHATYEESAQRMLDVLAAVNAELPFDGLRWAFDHAETFSDATLARVAALEGGIAVQGRMAFAGGAFLDRYGPEAARRAPPIKRMLELGIPVGAGTDGTRVASFNPWATYYWLVSGRTVGGRALNQPDDRLSREEALALFTTGSAWFSGEDDRKGRLAPGYYADFAILDRDILVVPEATLLLTRSLLTVVGGEIEHAAGPFADLAPPLPAALPAWSPVRFESDAPVYLFDRAHTNVLLKVDHLGQSTMVLEARGVEGYVRYDPAAPDATRVHVSFSAQAIDSDDQALNEHLNTDDFFAVDRFPTITFRGTELVLDDTGAGTLDGELTIRGITRPVTLTVRRNALRPNPITQLPTLGFSARTTIRRTDFGVNYAAGLIGDEVEIVIEAEVVRRY